MLKKDDYFEYCSAIYRVVNASESSVSIVPVTDENIYHKLGSTNISLNSEVQILSAEEKEKYIKRNKDGEPIKLERERKKESKNFKKDKEMLERISANMHKKNKKRGLNLEDIVTDKDIENIEAEKKELKKSKKVSKSKVKAKKKPTIKK